VEPSELAGRIDHSLLKPEAMEADVVRLCHEAKEYGFGAVCINPAYVQVAHKLLIGTLVKVCTVIDFPLGSGTSAVKQFEAGNALENGAQELDMVINIGALREGNFELVLRDIQAVVNEARRKQGTVVKVIIENCLLKEQEKIKACQLALQARADFVKTSTGFAGGGATLEDVRLMRKIVGQSMGIKAAGGIKKLSDARAMLEAGATRIGTSSGIAIMRELKGTT